MVEWGGGVQQELRQLRKDSSGRTEQPLRETDRDEAGREERWYTALDGG